MRPTVQIVDDHAAFRASARALLQAEGFDVIGEATDGAAAVAAVAALRPQIVLLDIQLPDLDGLPVAEQLAAAPDPPWAPPPRDARTRVPPQARAVRGGARRPDRLRRWCGGVAWSGPPASRSA
jgi:CheY-like chemotaxis protein